MTREDKKGLFIIFVLIVLGIGAFAFAYQVRPKTHLVDTQTLCSKADEIRFKKIVLIDKSDRWDDAHIKKIDHWLSNIHENIPMNGRLNILSIANNDKNQTELSTLFDRCSPGNETECNALYENCRDIRTQYNRAFESPLHQITLMLSDPSQTKNSPLFETMTSIVDNIQSPQAEIHIISDFMENGYKFNFYKNIPKADKLIKEYALPSDANITVHLHIIERRRHTREVIDKVKHVWEAYFSQQNIEVVSAKRFFISD